MANSPLLFDNSQDQTDDSSSNLLPSDNSQTTTNPSNPTPDSFVDPNMGTPSNLGYGPMTPMMRAAAMFLNNQQGNNGGGINTAQIGPYGSHILVKNSPTEGIDNLNAAVGSTISGVASNYLQQQQQQNRQSFIGSVHDIMNTNAPQQDKMNALLDLQDAHGTDYGLGLNNIAQKMGLGKSSPASMQNPAQRIQQLLNMGQLDPDTAHQQAVSQLGANYASKNPALAASIQNSANQTVLQKADQAIKQQMGQGYEVNLDWVQTGKGSPYQAVGVGISNDPNYNTLPPAQALQKLQQENPGYAAQLQMYVQGRGGAISASNRSARTQQMIQDLAFLYPGMDIDNVNQRVATLKDFSSGKSSQQIQSLNTVGQHLDTLNTLAGKLTSNQGWPLTNSLVQGVESATGRGDAATLKQFNFTKQALSDEIATTLKGAAGTDPQMEGIAKQIDSANSPQMLQGVIKTAANLITARLNSAQTKWGNTFNMPGDPQGAGGKPIIAPATQSILQKLGGQGEGQQSGSGNQQDYSSLWN